MECSIHTIKLDDMDVINLLLEKVEALSMAMSRCIKSFVKTQEKIKLIEQRIISLESRTGQQAILRKRRVKVVRAIKIQNINFCKN